MKKLLSLTSALALVLSLSACGGTEKPVDPEKPEQKVIKFYGLDGGYGQEGWKKVAESFEAKTGVKVEMTLDKNVHDLLRPIMVAGKDIPDVIYLSVGSNGGFTDTMVKEKNIQDITDVLKMTVPGETATVEEKMLDGFEWSSALSSSPYGDGKLYLAPTFYSPCGLFYNAGLFEQKGWEVPTTWDEFIKLGETAKKEGISLFTYPTTGYFDAFFSALLNEAAGPEAYGKLMNYDVDTWKSAEVKTAFEKVGELAKYVHPDTVANANGQGFTKNQQLILDNKALFIPNGTWLPGEMSDAPRAEGFKWGFMALPSLNDNGRYSSTFTEQVYIPNGAKNVDEAKQFIAYLYSDEAAKILYENGGAVTLTDVSRTIIPEDDANALYFDIYSNGVNANTVGFKAVEAIPGVDLTSSEGILYGNVNSVMNGSKTVDQWYDEVIKAVEQYAQK